MAEEAESVEGAEIEGRVKWYDPVKGYGFVVPDDGGADVMVHASCVRAFGRVSLPEEARVRLICGMGARGLHAQELLELEEPESRLRAVQGTDEGAGQGAGQGAADDRQARPTEFLEPGAADGPLEPARVKWFDKQKGFGFVNVFGNGEDVFVHMETVRRCGFQDLASGEGMAVRTFRGPRGLMVAELRLWEAGTLAGDRAAP